MSFATSPLQKWFPLHETVIKWVQKVQRFKGSKPNFEWSHEVVKSGYINIKYLIPYSEPF